MAGMQPQAVGMPIIVKLDIKFLHVQGKGIVMVWLAAAIKPLDKVVHIPRECIVHSLGG